MRGTDSHGWGGRRNLVTYEKRKTTVGVSLYRTILHQGATTALVLPELRADVRDQKFCSSFPEL
jgi:hypothetical protein